MQVNASSVTNAVYQVPTPASSLDPAGSGGISADGKSVVPADSARVAAPRPDGAAKALDLNGVEVPEWIEANDTRPAASGTAGPRTRPAPPPPPPPPPRIA